MTYARKTLSEIKLIHGDYGNFIKGQKLPKDKEKKYKTPPYRDLAASNEIDGETLNEKCWPGYEKKGMKTMFGKRYPNCVKKKKTRKEDFSDWRSDLEGIEEKALSKSQQRFMGMVYAYKKGEMPNASDEVKKAAEGMSKKDVEKYASTKHAKLPEKVEENTAIESELLIQDWNKDDIKFTEVEAIDIIKPEPLKPSPSNWRHELDEDWQKVNRKDKTDGLSRKAVKAYRRENPGSKLKTAVTKDPKKLKKGSKSAKRRLSFLSLIHISEPTRPY